MFRLGGERKCSKIHSQIKHCTLICCSCRADTNGKFETKNINVIALVNTRFITRFLTALGSIEGPFRRDSRDPFRSYAIKLAGRVVQTCRSPSSKWVIGEGAIVCNEDSMYLCRSSSSSQSSSSRGAHQRSRSMVISTPTFAASSTTDTTSSSASSPMEASATHTGASASSSTLPPLPPLPVPRQHPPLAGASGGGNGGYGHDGPAAFGHFPLPNSQMHYPFPAAAAAMGVPTFGAAGSGGGFPPHHHRFAMSAPLPHRFNTAAHAHANVVAAARAAAAAAFNAGQSGYLPQVLLCRSTCFSHPRREERTWVARMLELRNNHRWRLRPRPH